MTLVPHTDSAAAARQATSPATVLVVDDSPVNIQVLVRTLDGTGHRILVATNGSAALEIVRRAHPDLILLDVMMPAMDGFEVCRAIKSDPTTRDIVIIFLSALGEVEDKVAGLRLGAVDYITKPIQAEEVLARVSNQLVLRRLERELRRSRDELHQELASAAEMQRLILPRPLPKVYGLSFAAHYETSRHVGGDYYDVVRLSDDECGILIADVSGHGAPSAIVMAMIRAVFHAFPGPRADPSAVLQYINQQFRFLWGTSMLATALYAVVHIRDLRVRMACAGHLSPVLLRGDSAGPMETSGTIPLLLMDVPFIPCADFTLAPGDQLLFYTDGITEREDFEGKMYEIQRLTNAFISGRTLEPNSLLQSLAADVARFASGRELTDDQTLLLVSVDRR
jgi:sigma-B regulation protein RsbU (phosphoserine phosphatase)